MPAKKNEKAAPLADFRRNCPEKLVRDGAAEWRYRVIGTGPLTLLAIPGGELVNDLGFEFALPISDCCWVIYPAYPRVASMEVLASGLRAVLDAEKIDRAAILGASFGGALAQDFVRRHLERIKPFDALKLRRSAAVPCVQFANFIWDLPDAALL
ncbi:MAG: alpha/beta hydrolase [Terracidiphilus sp.]